MIPNMAAKEMIMEPLKLTQLSTESLRLFAESNGYEDLSNDVLELLSQDLNYKLTETVNIASQFMKHGFREKLSVGDVNRALICSDVSQIYGHSDSTIVSYENLPKTEVKSIKETEIDLLKYVNDNSKYEVIPMEYCRARWIAVEGISVNNGSMVDIYSSVPNLYNESHFNGLSEELKIYHKLMTKTILSNEPASLRIAFQDLRTNSKIGALLPYFVSFIHNGVLKTDDMHELCNFVTAINSLVSNPSLYLGHRPYHEILIDTLFCCLEKTYHDGHSLGKLITNNVSPLPEESQVAPPPKCAFDSWSFVEFVADVIVNVMRDGSPVSVMCHKSMAKLETIIKERHKTFTCQYGALVATIALGPVAVHSVVYPYLPEYMLYLSKIFANCTVENAQSREAAQKILNALLNASLMFLIYVSKNAELIKVDSHFTSLDIYRKFYDYFGNAFIAQLPIMELNKLYTANSILLFSSSEQPGIEMLKEFYKYERDEKNGRYKKSDSSYDSNLMMQEDYDCKRESSDSDSIGSHSRQFTSNEDSHTVMRISNTVIRIKKTNNSSKDKDISRSPAHHRTPDRNSPRNVESSPRQNKNYANFGFLQTKPKTGWKYVNYTAMFYRKLQSGNLNVML